MLLDILPKQIGAAWTYGLEMVCNLQYSYSQDDFDLTLSESQKNVVVRKQQFARNFFKTQIFLKQILESTERTCGKESNNPAEQNFASVVAFIDGTLYEDPAHEIKKLLAGQSMLEKKVAEKIKSIKCVLELNHQQLKQIHVSSLH